MFFAFCFYGVSAASIRREVGFRSVRYADVLVCEGQELPFLKPLTDALRGRTTVIEQYSRQPDAATRNNILHLSSTIQKEYQREQRQRRTEERSGAKSRKQRILSGRLKPVLVVISPSAPKDFIRYRLVAPHSTIRGVWSGLGPFAELLYVGVRDLPPSDRRWDQLRWGFAASDSPGVDRTRFFDDTTVALELRIALREMVMENKSTATPHEYRSVTEKVLAKGRREGGHRVINEMASNLLSSEELAELNKVSDVDERVATLLRMLRER